MSGKRSPARKAIQIIILVIVSLTVFALLIIGGLVIRETTPHTMHFNKVRLVSNNKFDGRYLYHGSNNRGKVFILRTETDFRGKLSTIDDNEYDFGEQDLTVRATGIEMFREDLSGIFISYPTIVYEYVSE